MRPIVGDFVCVLDLQENGQIIGFDEETNLYEVLLDKQDPIFEEQQWYSTDDISVLKREYKIINLTESPDHRTRQLKLLAELTPIQKTFSFMGDSLHCVSTFDPYDTELFLLPLNSSYGDYFINNPEQNKIIEFFDFTDGLVNMDGENIKAQIYAG